MKHGKKSTAVVPKQDQRLKAAAKVGTSLVDQARWLLSLAHSSGGDHDPFLLGSVPCLDNTKHGIEAVNYIFRT